MFQFRRFPSDTYTCVFSIRYMEMNPCGFPHSEICGSKCICHSPQLIAACHVLHRLLVPRHSPCALSSLTYPQALAWMVLELCGFSRTTKFVDTTHKFMNRIISSVALVLLHCSVFKVHVPTFWLVVGSNGLEPSTSRLSGARSNQLSYEPIFGFSGSSLCAIS